MKAARRFLDEGDKVKMTLRFRGREMAHQELGLRLLFRVRDDLSTLAKVEAEPQARRPPDDHDPGAVGEDRGSAGSGERAGLRLPAAGPTPAELHRTAGRRNARPLCLKERDRMSRVAPRLKMRPRAAVAQLVRASDCGSEGRWFESTRLYQSPHSFTKLVSLRPFQDARRCAGTPFCAPWRSAVPDSHV